MLRRIAKIAVALCLIVSACHAGTADDSPELSITNPEIRDHMYFLASDSLGGRVTDTEGFRMAALYCVSQFREAGIRPLFKTADGHMSYLQEVPLIKQSLSAGGPMEITTPNGTFTFKVGEYVKFTRTGDVSVFSGDLPLVYIGYGIQEPDAGWNDLEGVDIANSIVVMKAGAPLADGKAVLPQELHAKYMSIRGEYNKIKKLAESGPVAFIIIADQRISMFWPRIPDRISHPAYTLEPAAGETSTAELCSVLITEEVAKVLVPDLYTDSGEAAHGELTDTHIRLDLTETVEHLVSWNVVGVLEGTDPELRNEYIAVGAHLDHVTSQDGQIMNGADDNASGCVGVMEVAEALALAPPKRSVVFALFTAEELGLYGSRYFIRSGIIDMDQVKANITLDTIGRSDNAHRTDRGHYLTGYQETCAALRDYVFDVNRRTIDWPLTFVDARNIMGSSDHRSFHDVGIPAVFFHSGGHADLHRPTDDPEKIDYDKMVAITRLVYFIVRDLADGDLSALQ